MGDEQFHFRDVDGTSHMKEPYRKKTNYQSQLLRTI
jgi:hypothetical protein